MSTTGTSAPPTPTLPQAPVPTVPASGSGDSAQMSEAFSALDNYLTPGFGEKPPDAAPAPPADASLDPSGGLAPADVPPAKPKSTTSTSAPKGTKDAGASSAASKDSGSSNAPSKGSPPKSDKQKETPPADDPDEAQVSKMLPADLRKAYNKLRNRFTELQNRLETEEAKPPAKQDEEKQAKINEELETLRSKLKAVEDERALTNFEQSEAYKTQFYDPYVGSFNEGREALSGLTIVDPQTGEQRESTSEDFDAFMRITDKNAALQYAKDVFGDQAAPLAIMHRQEIIKANNRRVSAIEENKRLAQEHLAKQQEQSTKQSQAMEQAFKQHITAAAEKYPHWFKPTEGESLDPKVNQMLEHGMKLVDRLYGQEQLQPQELVALHAAVRNKAGAFDRVAYELNQAKKAIADLQAKLDAYEKSEPGMGTPGRASGSAAPSDTDWETKLDKYATSG